MNRHTDSNKSSDKSFKTRTTIWQHLPIAALLIFSSGLIFAASAQTPAPSPQGTRQDERGIGLSSDAAQKSSTAQNKAGGARPELVLQTGHGNLTGLMKLTFSPDGRLLATTTMSSNAVKLWEVATGRELRTLAAGGGAKFTSPTVAFSRDGRLIAAGGGDNSIKVWEVATGREIQTLSGPSGSIVASMGVSFVAFSPDARQLISVSDAVRTWDVATASEVRKLDVSVLSGIGVGAFGGTGVVLSSDGTQLASIITEGTKSKVKFWELATGREVRKLDLPDDTHASQSQLALASDGRVLLASIENRTLKLTDVTAKSKPRTLATTARDYGFTSFSPDGRLLALADGYTVKVWETATGVEAASLNVPSSGLFAERGMVFVGFSHDGRMLATGGTDTQTTLWDSSTGRAIRNLSGHSNMAYDVMFSADGRHLASGGKTRWDLASGRGLRLFGATNRLFGFPSPDGRLLASTSLDSNEVKIFDATTQKQLYSLVPANKGGLVNRVQFSSDGRLLATTYNLTEQEIKARTSQPAKQPSAEQMTAVNREAMKEMQKEAMKAAKSKNPADLMKIYSQLANVYGQPPGQQAAQPSQNIEDQIKIWDTATGREVRTLSAASGMPFGVGGTLDAKFSDDGRWLVSLGQNGQVTLWDVASGNRIHSFGGGGILGGGSSPIGSMTAAMLSGTSDSISTVAFSPDKRLLATGGAQSKSNFDQTSLMGAAMAGRGSKTRTNTQDILKELKIETTGQIKLWDTATGQEVATLSDASSKDVQKVTFSGDGRLLASSGSDNQIKIWDVSARRAVHTLRGHTASVNSLAFSPDARLLASAGDDGSTILWDASTGEQLATLVSLYDGGDWLVITPDGLFDGSPAAWNQVLWRYDGNTFNVAPIEWFFNEFYYPGLLSDIFAGRRPKATEDISQKDRRQPTVKVMLADAQATDAPLTKRDVKVRIEVTEAPADAENPQSSGARDLRLFRNGSLVKAWRGDVLQGKASVTLEADLPVVAGDNKLTAYAFNRDNVKSRDALLALKGADTLKRAGTAYVLAVGVNAYANSHYNLKYAVADARSFGEEVRRQQLALGRFARVEVISLFDQEATKSNILKALNQLAGNTESLPPTLKAQPQQLPAAQPEDAVFIYFAGHGTAQGQRFYLLPHDIGYKGDRTTLDAAGLQTILAHSISDEELERAVEGLDASQLLLVIDACNSGQALEAEEKRRGPMNSKGLAQLAYEKGMYILTAAQSYQAALEAAQLGHGYLTYALVEEGLKSPLADAAPKDGLLLTREWFDYATERVPLMQELKMKETRGIGLSVAFVEGEEKVAEPERRSVQRPRAFYRRELETNPLVVAKPATK